MRSKRDTCRHFEVALEYKSVEAENRRAEANAIGERCQACS